MSRESHSQEGSLDTENTSRLFRRKMLAIQTLHMIVSTSTPCSQALEEGGTYTLPQAKIPQIATFCFQGRCSEEIRGIGRIMRVKSVTMFTDAFENHSAVKSKQWPGNVGSQNFATGMQVRIALRTAHRYHPTRNARIQLQVVRMPLRGKVRRYRRTIEHLVQPKLECMNGIEYHISYGRCMLVRGRAWIRKLLPTDLYLHLQLTRSEVG